jgi:hypothetical protein
MSGLEQKLAPHIDKQGLTTQGSAHHTQQQAMKELKKREMTTHPCAALFCK